MAAGLRQVWVIQQIPLKKKKGKRNGGREGVIPISAIEHYPTFKRKGYVVNHEGNITSNQIYKKTLGALSGIRQEGWR